MWMSIISYFKTSNAYKKLNGIDCLCCLAIEATRKDVKRGPPKDLSTEVWSNWFSSFRIGSNSSHIIRMSLIANHIFGKGPPT